MKDVKVLLKRVAHYTYPICVGEDLKHFVKGNLCDAIQGIDYDNLQRIAIDTKVEELDLGWLIGWANIHCRRADGICQYQGELYSTLHECAAVLKPVFRRVTITIYTYESKSEE